MDDAFDLGVKVLVWILVGFGMLALLAGVSCAAHVATTSPEQLKAEDIAEGCNRYQPTLVSSVDGFDLYCIYNEGHPVYWSKSGVSYSENCGRNCIRDVQVPAN